MGLLRAAGGAVGGVLADQWREYFYCDALPLNVLVRKGIKRVSDTRSSNTKGTDNVISNGAVIAVNEGQAMAIVDQGKVVEFCAEAGKFTWESSSQPSIFYGKLGKGIVDSFKEMGRRFGLGGDAGTDQRIYFFNLKEIVANKYGTASPIPFRIVDKNTGLDLDANAKCNGEYSFKLVDPIKFYTNVSGNVTADYEINELSEQMKAELLTALQPVFGKLSEMGIRYSAVPAHTQEICDLLKEELSEKWFNIRGIEIVSFGCNSITLTKEDEDMIKEMQRSAALSNPSMGRGYITGATGEAMKGAATNDNGAMAGFMGMGMAGMAGGANLNGAFNNEQGQQAPQNNYPVADNGGFGSGVTTASEKHSWTCECGTENTGKFCQNCGKPKPENKVCPKCGRSVSSTAKFCEECGTQV